MKPKPSDHHDKALIWFNSETLNCRSKPHIWVWVSRFMHSGLSSVIHLVLDQGLFFTVGTRRNPRSAITKDDDDEIADEVKVKEFNMVGIKVVKTLKDGRNELKGRISFFSRSNCRDIGVVQSFMREWNFNYVEINIDVYPGREKELREKMGSTAVPQRKLN